MYVCVFFVKQTTAYEMRISDWSSDVCSSDLVGKASNFAGQVEPRLIFAEAVFDQQRKLLHGMGRLFARSADRDIIALGRAQHHQAHDRSAGHGLPILFDQDFAGQATGKRDELCTGPRMQAALVRDLHLSPVSGHVDVPSSSDATLIYFWPASRPAATSFFPVIDIGRAPVRGKD